MKETKRNSTEQHKRNASLLATGLAVVALLTGCDSATRISTIILDCNGNGPTQGEIAYKMPLTDTRTIYLGGGAHLQVNKDFLSAVGTNDDNGKVTDVHSYNGGNGLSFKTGANNSELYTTTLQMGETSKTIDIQAQCVGK